MSLIDLSGKLDTYTIEFYDVIVSTANSLGVQFLVVGATARDLMLEWVYNLPPHRRTEDIDLGVRIKSWEEFETLKTALEATGKFTSTNLSQRLQYNGTHPIDIVPFGEISRQDNLIMWPPDNDVHLNVEGFKEALENCLVLKLRDNPALEIPVASLPSQVVLKLFAWSDRRYENSKDAIDIAIIARNYGNINEDRLFGEESAIMTEEDFDIDYAGARLLGLDIGRTLDQDMLLKVKEILNEQIKEQAHHDLAIDMSGYIGTEFERSLNLLMRIKEGLSG